MEEKWVERRGSHETQVSGIRVSVHHYAGCRDAWFTSDRYFSSQTELKSESLEDAKAEAIKIFSLHVTRLYEGLGQ